jgi:hypothetical protein
MASTKRRQRVENDRVVARRELVGRLRVRGMTTREIAQAIFEQGYANADGYAYSHKTIVLDLKALRKQWADNAAASMEEHKARQLEEIQQLKRLAWTNQDGALALRAIETEMKLTGTAAAQKLDITISPEVATMLGAILKVMARLGMNTANAFELLMQRVDALQTADEWAALMQRGPGRIEYIEIGPSDNGHG